MDEMMELEGRLRARLPGLDLQRGAVMAAHTTFQIGGPVSLLAQPRSVAEARVVLEEAWGLGIEPFFLGNGSNLLVSDAGADCLVVKGSGDFYALDVADETSLYGGSGATLRQAAELAQRLGLSGLEFAHGIPGSMGGGVRMNAGAYGGEMSQVVAWVDCLTLAGQPQRLSGAELAFGYRRSRFSQGDLLVTGACLRLHPGDPAAIQATMDDLLAQRQSKQPLEFPSAGSIFKRPSGHFAGTLIDQCGLKGCRVGGAQVSAKHAGFIVNTGGATCQDVRRLIEHVQRTVQAQTGVTLEPEVRTLGFQF